jgi:signal transduction histidine kinase
MTKLAEYEAEIERLKKINGALITRIEAGAAGSAAYDSFAHSVFLADQVRERTAALNDALQQLTQSNRELEHAKAQAEQAKVGQTRLLTAISHDIMQPVCAAQLLVDNLLLNDQMTTENRQINAISQAVGDIEYLLQSLLDYARQGQVIKAELRPQAVDDVLASLAIESLPQAQAKGLDFIYRPANLWVMTDANILTRVLRNLISNSLRYTSSGEVELAVTGNNKEVIISIKDTGSGFEESYAGEILEPFKKAANNGNNEGLGLGLANVASLCMALGHRLDYHSQPHQGSEFLVTLTATEPRMPSRNAQRPAGTLPFPYSVLVIDNSAAVREAVGILLDSWGASSHCFACIKDVPEALLNSVDILIMDYHLDNQRTGLQALQQRPVPCPVLFITASNDEVDLQAINEAGYRLVKKPVRPPRLRIALENIIETFP